MITILGGGAFGAGLAIALSTTQDVRMWMRNPDAMQGRSVPRLPDAPLPETVTITPEIGDSGAVLLAVPMQQLGNVLAQFPQLDGRPLVACCKGMDLTTGLGPTGIIARSCPSSAAAILTGPSFAADIARGLPTALTLASTDGTVGKSLQHQISTPRLRVYLSDDPIGAELGGALKNVIAIACGVCIGAGWGDSARAALMTRGFAEMSRLGQAIGAKPETLAGLSGFGDLALTCTSHQSRNFRYGLALGRDEPFDSHTTVEGAATAKAVCSRARDLDVDMPIATAVAALADGALTPHSALDSLLSRPLRKE